MKLVLVLFQKLFRIYGGHAARARSGNRLAIAVVLYVAGNEHTGNCRQAAVLGEQIAAGIHFELSLEDDGVWIVTNGDEYSIERYRPQFLCLRIADAHTFNV